MRNLKPGPAVVVGVDGSRAAVHAAVWAVDEAASRDIPLRLVCVVDPMQPAGSSVLDVRQAAARSALYDAYRAVEATGTPVKVETEILWGKPLNKLMAESRSATMICVGSMGINHARCGKGSVAGALAGAALCPVAVIHRAADAAAPRSSGWSPKWTMVRCCDTRSRRRGYAAFRCAPSRCAPPTRSTPATEARRLGRNWIGGWPAGPGSTPTCGSSRRSSGDTPPVTWPSSLNRASSFVTDTHAAQVCSVYNAGSSVLTVRCGNL